MWYLIVNKLTILLHFPLLTRPNDPYRKRTILLYKIGSEHFYNHVRSIVDQRGRYENG